ncbi:MAG: polysaccharide biosynthesis protein [Flavobacteriaceae bacterium]|nr:polysaccharide biosynthesis protein [Flavobacteriaceae bacterium]
MIRAFLLKNTNVYVSKWLIFGIDLFLLINCLLFSYFIRFNFSVNFDVKAMIDTIPFVIVLGGLSFLLVGSHKGVIRHTSEKDAVNVFLAVSLLAWFEILFVGLNRYFSVIDSFTIPLTIIAIQFILSVLVLISSRFIFKAVYHHITTVIESSTNVMIYGAGDSGILTCQAIKGDKKNNFQVIGFIDDDKLKRNKKVHGITVFRRSSVNLDFIIKYGIHEIIIAIQTMSGEQLTEIVDYYLEFNVKVKIVPNVSEWLHGSLHSGQIKEVRIEDLLNRTPIKLDNSKLMEEFVGKTVFVTGGAGSIGSEIVRQLVTYHCARIVVIDQAESVLYELEQELIQKGAENVIAIVGDVRDYSKMNLLFEEYLPVYVFHAAAYKHVPLMEQNPYEAVKVNVGGTKLIADLSSKYGVSKFVMVSTDKAVNPSNVMGATKRIAEIYVGSLKNKDGTKFITTRFGNVLGSNGSVIPLFRKQILNGGPLSLTHKEITRYFMTIPEACQLVIEAGVMGSGGEIFIFDMGESVKIFDLAKRMIYLSGFSYPNEIDIVITGLRPGEKLYEELLAEKENTLPTHHEKIMIAKVHCFDPEKKQEEIAALCVLALSANSMTIVEKMKEIVPEFISNNSAYQVLDKKHGKGEGEQPRMS